MPLSHSTVAKMCLVPYLLLVVILDVNHVIDDNHSNVSFQTVMYFILPIIFICVNDRAIIVVFPLVASVIGIDALLSWKRYKQTQDPSQYVLHLGNV